MDCVLGKGVVVVFGDVSEVWACFIDRVGSFFKNFGGWEGVSDSLDGRFYVLNLCVDIDFTLFLFLSLRQFVFYGRLIRAKNLLGSC